MSWIFDSSAVICWLRAEPGSARAEAILLDSAPVAIHAINLVEVRYVLLRLGEHVLHSGDTRIASSGIEVVRSLDNSLLNTAVDLKARFTPIALGDVFGVALAATRGATFVTTDRHELEKVAAASVCAIEFLR